VTAPAASTPFAPTVSASIAERLLRCVVGLVVCGVGIALMVVGDVGLAPWDVLHRGISTRTDAGIGTVIIAVGFVLLVVWIPLRVRPGVGTILNAVLLGATVNVLLPVLPEPGAIAVRTTLMVLGVVAFGLGTGLYIGAGLGPGPRDGLMTGIAARGHSLRLVRTAIELSVLVVGWALGGSVGLGTAVFALTIGPLVQFFLTHLGVQAAPAANRPR